MALIRKDTDYAFRSLLHLATAHDGAVSGSDLARSCGIPKAFAYKILERMRRAGIVSSQGGRRGGFRLVKDPGGVSLMEVVNVFQGALTVSRCVLDPVVCERHSTCPLASGWAKVQGALVGFLGSTTLEDLLVWMRKRRGAKAGRRRRAVERGG